MTAETTFGGSVKKFYRAVAEVYEQVAQASPQVTGNPCGTCRTCCTSASNHRVSELELATMERHLGAERVAPFRRYLGRETDENGALRYPNCPMLGDSGCTVHEVRPMSCRLYGHFRAASSPLFEHCVFRGQETVFEDHQEHLLTPGQPALTELNLEYLSYFPPADSVLPERSRSRLRPQTRMETASELKCDGDYAAARDLLLVLRQEGETPNLLLMLAECQEALSEYQAAIDVLEAALQQSPENPELHTRLGANRLWLGQLEGAASALGRSLDLAPERRNAQGLLGVVRQMQGDLASSRAHLSKAVELENEPGPYRFSLATVLRDLGDLPASRDMFRRSLDYPPTRAAAQNELDLLS